MIRNWREFNRESGETKGEDSVFITFCLIQNASCFVPREQLKIERSKKYYSHSEPGVLTFGEVSAKEQVCNPVIEPVISAVLPGLVMLFDPNPGIEMAGHCHESLRDSQA